MALAPEGSINITAAFAKGGNEVPPWLVSSFSEAERGPQGDPPWEFLDKVSVAEAEQWEIRFANFTIARSSFVAGKDLSPEGTLAFAVKEDSIIEEIDWTTVSLFDAVPSHFCDTVDNDSDVSLFVVVINPEVIESLFRPVHLGYFVSKPREQVSIEDF